MSTTKRTRSSWRQYFHIDTGNARCHHGLACSSGAGRQSRHAALNDILRRALVSADVPVALEPQIVRDDGKRPDGMSLIPWCMGRALVWDATCADTLAASYLPATSKQAGAAADARERFKTNKYSCLGTQYEFVPFGVETLGPWGKGARELHKALSKSLWEATGDPRAGSFLAQRIAIAIQRGNAACHRPIKSENNSQAESIADSILKPSTSTRSEDSVNIIPTTSASQIEDPVGSSTPKRQKVTIEASFSKILEFGSGGSKNKQITDAIAELIYRDNLPFSVVEGEGFGKLIKLLAPLYKIPCRKTITSIIDGKYEEKKAIIIKKLQSVTNICLTIDEWKDLQMKSYLGVTIHFIKNFKIFSFNIACEPLSESHTMPNIYQPPLKIFVKNGKFLMKKLWPSLQTMVQI
ncbi:uncharacterized protein LOC132904401 [Amyelois transitella]|uniref:uncharacterized protein LOC132904401 n=1 Tax=Amyelois transitella TaxID=680683 RepID=UPI00298F64DD|nr:uncharacterized protein LOC132904401 [Amyelois transitella]